MLLVTDFVSGKHGIRSRIDLHAHSRRYNDSGRVKKGNMIHGFKIDGLKCGCAVNGEYLRLFSKFLATPRTSTAFRARYSPKDSLLEFVGRSTSVIISNAARRVRDLC